MCVCMYIEIGREARSRLCQPTRNFIVKMASDCATQSNSKFHFIQFVTLSGIQTMHTYIHIHIYEYTRMCIFFFFCITTYTRFLLVHLCFHAHHVHHAKQVETDLPKTPAIRENSYKNKTNNIGSIA